MGSLSKICLPLTLLLKPPLQLFFPSLKIHHKVIFRKIPSKQHQSDMFRLSFEDREKKSKRDKLVPVIERMLHHNDVQSEVKQGPHPFVSAAVFQPRWRKMRLDTRSHAVINGDRIGSVALWCDGEARFVLGGQLKTELIGDKRVWSRAALHVRMHETPFVVNWCFIEKS